MKQSVLVGIFFALVALPTAFSDPTGCQQFIDVIAVVDGSGSIASKDFREVRAALKDFVRELGVSSSVRFGVIVYSSSVGDVIPLSGDASDLTYKINNLAQPGAGTRTDLGIAKMIEMFSGSSSPKVGIVITDGKSSNTNATLTQAANAKNQNINIFAIGVGTNINSQELNGIASSTDQVLHVTNYTLLAQQITSLVVDICPNPTGCQQFIDVIAVVDGSGSIASKDFREVRAALKDFVRELGVSSSVRFGVIVYSSSVGDVIPLSGDASDLTNKINNLAQPGAGTRTDLGIAKMIEMFSGSSSPKVGIVITDGKSGNTNATLTQAANAKNQNINIFAIGVGTNINSQELNGIASSTDQVLHVTNYTLLAQQITSLVVDICPNPTGCQQFIDVIAVVDGSGSIASKDFREVRTALKDFVRELGVSSSVRFGVIVYSSSVGDVIPLSGDASDLTNKINNLAQPGGGTRTDLGIAKMIEMFSGSSSPKVGIVITDGKSGNTNATLTQAANAKNQNINIFAIGVGTNINSQELNGIASSTDQVLLVTNYTLLAQQITSLVVEICATTTTTNPCDGCKMLNGIGYNPHTDCDKFIQCEFKADLTLLRYHEKQCGYGTYWNQDKLTCDHIGSVACDNDPCNANVDGYSYKTSGNCSQYYRCVDGKTQVRQCPPGYSYDSILGYCVVNTTCKNPVPIPDTCEYRGRTNDRCNYDWVTASGTFYKLPCPPGTTFNQADCRCDTELGTSCYPSCKPIVDIQFDSNDSGEYDNYGAIIQNGQAYFDGNSTIRILTLANVDFRSKINMKVRYRNQYYSSQGQAVVTNGDCGKQPSISIVSKQYTVQFNLEDTTLTTHSLDLNTNDQWRDVEYSLKDGQFTAKVNSLSTMGSIPADAGILRSQCAFLLGQGTGFQNFKGWIDYITVSTC